MLTMLCTKMLRQQRWRQCRCGDGVAERMVGGKGGGAGRGAYAASLLLTGRNTFEQTTWILHSSCNWRLPLPHQGVSVHHNASPKCMDDFASSQSESLHCSCCKRYTWTSWTECWKDGNVSILKERSPTCTQLPSYLLPLWRGTCNIFAEQLDCIISQMFNKISKAEFHPHQMCRLSIKRNNCCYKGCPSFFFNTLSKIWIITLVTTMTCVDHIITRGLSIIMGSWTNLTAQPHSRRTNLLFPFLIPLSTALLAPICHSSFPAIYCAIACLKCMLTNVLLRPSLESFVGTSRQGG